MRIVLSLMLTFLVSQWSLAQVVPADTLAPPVEIAATPADTVVSDDEDREEETAAQEDTVQSSDPTGFHYRLTADGTASRGNVDRTLVQLGSSFDWATSRRIRLASSPAFVYGRQNGLLNEREWTADLRTTYLHQRRFYYLAFGAWERSNLRKINHRTTAGAGVGYKLIERPKTYLSVTNVLLHEMTDFAEKTDVSVLRNSTRIFGEYAWAGSRYNLTHTLFIQPALGKPNFRWNGSMTFQIKMTSTISLQTTLLSTYESVVVPGRKKYDLRWTMGISLRSI